MSFIPSSVLTLSYSFLRGKVILSATNEMRSATILETPSSAVLWQCRIAARIQHCQRRFSTADFWSLEGLSSTDSALQFGTAAVLKRHCDSALLHKLYLGEFQDFKVVKASCYHLQLSD